MLKFKIGKIEIILCFSFFAVIALLELLKENNYLLLCLTACILHELGHIFAMCLFSIAPNKITFYGAGIKITPGYNKITAFSQDLIILMAGSVTNLIIFAFITLFRNHNFTNEVFAAINLSIGIFNLIPFKHFDGGKIIDLFLSEYCLKMGRVIREITRWVSIILLVVFSIAFVFEQGGNVSLYISVTYIIISELFL